MRDDRGRIGQLLGDAIFRVGGVVLSGLALCSLVHFFDVLVCVGGIFGDGG